MNFKKLFLHLAWLRKIYIYVRLFSDLEYLSTFWNFSNEFGHLNCYSEDIGYLFDDLLLEEALEKSEWESIYFKVHSLDFYLSLIRFKNLLNEYDIHWENHINHGVDYFKENISDVINDPQFLKVVNYCKEFLPVLANEISNNLYQSLPPIIFSKLNRVYCSVDEIDYEQLNNDLKNFKAEKR